MVDLYDQVSGQDASAIKSFENQILDLRKKRERLQAKTRDRDTVQQNKLLKIIEDKLLASLKMKQKEMK